MTFPSDDELRSPQEPIEFGGEGFDIVRFVYERGADDRAHVDITWANRRTREIVTYRFNSVVHDELWWPGASVSTDRVHPSPGHLPRPFRVYQPEVDGFHRVMFYAGSVKRLPPAAETAAG